MAANEPNPSDLRKSIFTDEEIEKITEEERLRNRLRAEFISHPKEKSRSGWWEFLNSSFGLFLLSSVVLGGITGLYAQAQYHSRQLEARNQEILKIASELEYRLEMIEDYSEEMKKAQPGNKSGASLFIWYTLEGGSHDPGPKYFHSLLPEFNDTPTNGLLVRLRLLGLSDGTDEALETVRAMKIGQTEPDGPTARVYPQNFLDSHVQELAKYTNSILIPYLAKERHRSLIRAVLFGAT